MVVKIFVIPLPVFYSFGDVVKLLLVNRIAARPGAIVFCLLMIKAITLATAILNFRSPPFAV